MPKVKLSKAAIDAIPYTDAGQMLVWDRKSDVLKWLEQRTCNSTSEYGVR